MARPHLCLVIARHPDPAYCFPKINICILRTGCLFTLRTSFCAERRLTMTSLKTLADPQPRAAWARNFHPDILLLLDVFARIERRRQERLRQRRAGYKH